MPVRVLEKPVQKTEQVEKATCIHHWIIEPPEGPISKGYCKKCGEQKEFRNYFPYSQWENAQGSGESTDSFLVNLDV